MRPTFSARDLAGGIRAVAPLALTLCCLVVGLAPAPGGATPPARDGGESLTGGTNHTANVTLYDADDVEFDSAESVESAVESGIVGPADRLVVNETLVVVVDSQRLADAMAARNGSATEQFLGALDGEADLRVVEREPSPMVTRMYATVGRENVTAYRDGATVYILLYTGDLTFRRDANETHSVTVDSFYKDRVSVLVGFELPPPGDWPRDEFTSGPTVELISERYVTPTGTPTASPTPPPHTHTQTTAARDQRGTETRTATNRETPLPTSSANGSESASAPRTTTREDGAGFTVAATLAALVGLVLLGRYRR